MLQLVVPPIVTRPMLEVLPWGVTMEVTMGTAPVSPTLPPSSPPLPVPPPPVVNDQGSQPFWKSGKTLKMIFLFSSQGKLGRFVTDPEGKGFRQFLVMCVLIDWLTGYSGFCEYYTPLQTITVGCARTTSWLPSNLIKGKVFLMEFWNFLREISGKTQGISFS